MQQILEPIGAKVIAFELPFFTGPEACLHLLSLISPIDVDLAVAYPPLMPVPFWKELQRRGIQLIEVPEDEFQLWQGTNILAIAPRGVAMLDHNPVTQRAARRGRRHHLHVPRRAALLQGRRRPHLPHPAGVARRRMTAAGPERAERRALAQVDPVALLSDLDTLVTARSVDGAESAAQQAAAGLMRKHGLRTHEWQIDLAELHRHPSFGSEVERTEALGLVGEIGGTPAAAA